MIFPTLPYLSCRKKAIGVAGAEFDTALGCHIA